MTCAELGLTGVACENHHAVKGGVFLIGVVLLIFLVAWITERN